MLLNLQVWVNTIYRHLVISILNPNFIKSEFSILKVAFKFNNKTPWFVIHCDNKDGKVTAVKEVLSKWTQIWLKVRALSR